MKLKNNILSITEKIKKLGENQRKKAIIGMVVFIFFILWAGFHYVPRWFGQYQTRTRFYKATEKLDAVSEEKAMENITGQCKKIRNSADKLYSASEISGEIEKNTGGEKLRLIGREEINSEENQKGSYLLLNVENKEVELLCFDFSDRVIAEGKGKLEIGFSNFKSIDSNALSLSGGQGKIHHNLIENSSKAGIFAIGGSWEIHGNVIKNNLSYGVYGDYEAELQLRENAITDNGGYEVRILKERKVYR